MSTHGPLFTKPGQGVLVLWAALAMLNLAAGVVIASHESRASDLVTVMRWGHAWLMDRSNIYASIDSVTDYPPNAIVLLSPLGLLPLAAAVPLWAFVNLCLTVIAPYLAARFYRPYAPFRVILLPILMFLCWGGVRTLLQFSLLALTLSMITLVVFDRKPFASGAVLGLALMKPQVALPVFCWALFTRRWKVIATSAVVVTMGVAIFCLWAKADPFFVIRRYVAILADYHTGETLLAGLSELRPAIRALMSDVAEVDAIAGSIALGLLVGICVAGFQEGSARKRVLFAAPPLVACWTLLTFYHLTYGFIVLLPVMMMLALNNTEHSPLRRSLFWTLQIGMMIDVPGLARRSGVTTGTLGLALTHVDRVLMLCLFAGLVVLAWKEPPLPDIPSRSQQGVG
jgi:glycosyl transferase family 87